MILYFSVYFFLKSSVQTNIGARLCKELLTELTIIRNRWSRERRHTQDFFADFLNATFNSVVVVVGLWMLCSGRMGQVCVNIGKLSEREVIIKLGTYGWRVSGRLNLDRGEPEEEIKRRNVKRNIWSSYP